MKVFQLWKVYPPNDTGLFGRFFGHIVNKTGFGAGIFATAYLIGLGLKYGLGL